MLYKGQFVWDTHDVKGTSLRHFTNRLGKKTMPLLEHIRCMYSLFTKYGNVGVRGPKDG